MFAKNASVVAAWTDTVRTSAPAARLVFDRLLGANHVYPEADGYKQRPFTWEDISILDFSLSDPRSELDKHGVQTDPKTGAALSFFQPDTKPPSKFGLLAPSIYFVSVDESKGELHVFGTFGSDARPNASVTVGGVQYQIKDWKQGQVAELVIDLPPSGQGSAGDVFVTIRQHKSNVAQLTDWNAQFLQTFDGPGSVRQPVTYNVHLRLDIRKRRDKVHEPPQEPQITSFQADWDSSGSYSCSGSSRYDFAPNYIIDSWTGSGNLVYVFNPALPPPNKFIAGGALQDSTLIKFSLLETDMPLCDFNEHDHVEVDGTVFDFDMPGTVGLFPTGSLFAALGYVPLRLATNATILGDSREKDVDSGFVAQDDSTAHVKLRWTDIVPQYPPDPNAAR